MKNRGYQEHDWGHRVQNNCNRLQLYGPRGRDTAGSESMNITESEGNNEKEGLKCTVYHLLEES